jgi:hypothetical protein
MCGTPLAVRWIVTLRSLAGGALAQAEIAQATATAALWCRMRFKRCLLVRALIGTLRG